MSPDSTADPAGTGELGNLRELLEVWRVLAPIRETAGKIDWQKLLDAIQKIMPLIVALLELLPKKPA
jgi:hypothetical protein